MTIMKWAGCALAIVFAVSGARAADTTPCGKNLVCASAPSTIIEAVQKAGYKATLDKDNDGDPMIESAASGYNFSIYFYGCVERNMCDSLRFAVNFKDDGANALELANLWNRDKRFAHMAVNKNKSLNIGYDVTTVGGLNQENFADLLDWWATMLGEASKFFKEHPARK